MPRALSRSSVASNAKQPPVTTNSDRSKQLEEPVYLHSQIKHPGQDPR